jgi:hypothetical protein
MNSRMSVRPRCSISPVIDPERSPALRDAVEGPLIISLVPKLHLGTSLGPAVRRTEIPFRADVSPEPYARIAKIFRELILRQAQDDGFENKIFLKCRHPERSEAKSKDQPPAALGVSHSLVPKLHLGTSLFPRSQTPFGNVPSSPRNSISRILGQRKAP